MLPPQARLALTIPSAPPLMPAAAIAVTESLGAGMKPAAVHDSQRRTSPVHVLATETHRRICKRPARSHGSAPSRSRRW